MVARPPRVYFQVQHSMYQFDLSFYYCTVFMRSIRRGNPFFILLNSCRWFSVPLTWPHVGMKINSHVAAVTINWRRLLLPTVRISATIYCWRQGVCFGRWKSPVSYLYIGALCFLNCPRRPPGAGERTSGLTHILTLFIRLVLPIIQRLVQASSNAGYHSRTDI